MDLYSPWGVAGALDTPPPPPPTSVRACRRTGISKTEENQSARAIVIRKKDTGRLKQARENVYNYNEFAGMFSNLPRTIISDGGGIVNEKPTNNL